MESLLGLRHSLFAHGLYFRRLLGGGPGGTGHKERGPGGFGEGAADVPHPAVVGGALTGEREEGGQQGGRSAGHGWARCSALLPPSALSSATVSEISSSGSVIPR